MKGSELFFNVYSNKILEFRILVGKSDNRLNLGSRPTMLKNKINYGKMYKT